jgi:hypothetical protein
MRSRSFVRVSSRALASCSDVQREGDTHGKQALRRKQAQGGRLSRARQQNRLQAATRRSKQKTLSNKKDVWMLYSQARAPQRHNYYRRRRRSAANHIDCGLSSSRTLNWFLFRSYSFTVPLMPFSCSKRSGISQTQTRVFSPIYSASTASFSDKTRTVSIYWHSPIVGLFCLYSRSLLPL